MGRGNQIKKLFSYYGRNEKKSYQVLYGEHTDMMSGKTQNLDPVMAKQGFKLSIVLLGHLFFVDDGKISYLEKKSFHRAVDSLEDLSLAERDELKDILSSSLDFKFVMNYIVSKDLNGKHVNFAANHLRDNVKLTGKDPGRLLHFEKKFNEYIENKGDLK